MLLFGYVTRSGRREGGRETRSDERGGLLLGKGNTQSGWRAACLAPLAVADGFLAFSLDVIMFGGSSSLLLTLEGAPFGFAGAKSCLSAGRFRVVDLFERTAEGTGAARLSGRDVGVGFPALACRMGALGCQKFPCSG
ncbi:hypothetical protein MRX96_005812 [Rhipicephalus microplus]